ncbi:MAG: CAP domain-containing protein [Candidatus Moranbacteria bacterium]|nr:CAP domain-containing protein [Candidatus Moranbacteria bacterium]
MKTTFASIKTHIFFFGIFFFFPFSFVCAGESQDTITAERVLELVNESRLSNGMGILSFDTSLNRASSLKAKDMFEKQYFAHTTPSGQEPWYFVNLSGYDYRMAGENLAIHFDSALEQHVAWMESPLHRKNILNPEYQDIGVAVAKGKFKNFETTIVVQFFGKKQYIESVVAEEKKDDPLHKEKIQDVIVSGAEISYQNKSGYQESFLKSFSLEEIIFLLFIVGIPFIVVSLKLALMYFLEYFQNFFWNTAR